MNGAGMGLAWFVMYGAMGLAFWAGTQFVLKGECSGGDVLLVSTTIVRGLT